MCNLCKSKRFFVFSLIILINSFLWAKAAAEPDWYLDYRSVFPDSEYLAQKGSGKKAEESKTDALAQLTRYLQTSVNANLSTRFEASSDGKNASENTYIIDEVNVSSNVTLSGLEFTEPYYNKKEKKWYCLAYVSRQKFWEAYRPTLQNARGRLFAFYDLAEKNDDPLSKLFLYSQSSQYEKDFYTCYSFATIISKELTSQYYGQDSNYVASINSKLSQEKSNCTFAIKVSGDVQNIIYQKIKDELSREGYTVRNENEKAIYSVKAVIQLDDMIMNSLHVIKPGIELTIEGKTISLFSYAKQQKNVSGINEDITKVKAVRSLSDELQLSFIQEFNEKLNKTTNDELMKLK